MRKFGDPGFFGERYAHEYDERTGLDPARAARYTGWDSAPFTRTSKQHVTVYEKA